MASSNRIPHNWFATTIADLQSLPVAPLDDGARVWVESTRTNYYLSRTANLFVDGVNVIAPSAQAAAGEPLAQWLSDLLTGGQLASGVAMMTVDQATLNSGAFAPVPQLSVTLATGAGSLDIEYDICGISQTGSTFFRVMVDGVEAQFGGVNVSRSTMASTATDSPATVAASMRILGVTAGSHTVIVQYATTTNLVIRPATGSEHGTLRVEEVALV